MVIANLLTAGMTLILGLLIKYGKLYGLIAGYNTTSPDERERTDIVGLGTFIGNGMLVVTAILAGGVLLEYWNVIGAAAGSWWGFVFVVLYIAVRAQRFTN